MNKLFKEKNYVKKRYTSTTVCQSEDPRWSSDRRTNV